MRGMKFVLRIRNSLEASYAKQTVAIMIVKKKNFNIYEQDKVI